MDYDFRNRANPPYDSHAPIYRPNSSSSSSHQMYGSSSLYPRVGQPAHSVNPPPSRQPTFQHPSSSSNSPGFGIRVSIKPEYRITPPPQLSHVGDIPRCTFQFDFDLERRILAEAEKESQNWSRLGLENFPSKPAEPSTSSLGSNTDPVVSKYVASGLSREAVPFAVATYGDNPAKVREFVNGYTLLREMGFSSKNVVEALAMYDNDTNKALAYFLNNAS